jgi:hypothetical protein
MNKLYSAHSLVPTAPALITAPADKMHNFHLVVSLQQSVVPLGAANHVVIEFDCDLFYLEIQLRD